MVMTLSKRVTNTGEVLPPRTRPTGGTQSQSLPNLPSPRLPLWLRPTPTASSATSPRSSSARLRSSTTTTNAHPPEGERGREHRDGAARSSPCRRPHGCRCTTASHRLCPPATQRDIPLTALLPAYALDERFLALALNAAARLDSPEVADVMIDLVHVTSSYVDHVEQSGRGGPWPRERERWVQDRDIIEGHWVCQILSGQPVDSPHVEIALGYSLSAQHVAAEVWAEPARGRDRCWSPSTLPLPASLGSSGAAGASVDGLYRRILCSGLG